MSRGVLNVALDYRRTLKTLRSVLTTYVGFRLINNRGEAVSFSSRFWSMIYAL